MKSLMIAGVVLFAMQVARGQSPQMKAVADFLGAHCARCHGEKKQKGGVDFRAYQGFTPENAEHWQDVLHNIERGEMPPKEERQPDAATRRAFVELLRAQLDKVHADADARDFRFLRRTNQQIAWSWRDLLQIDRDYSQDLLQDPAGKHGQSLQSTLELTGGHMEAYLVALRSAVEDAVPDLEKPPAIYSLRGNDWEKQHYLSRNDLAFSQSIHQRRYLGPEWLGDKFQIPLPPGHFFRIYLDDNRPEGQFRARITLRNEPPQNGGERIKHEMTVFLDKGFKSPMHAVQNFTVEARPGTQVFEVFGNVEDFPGVDPSPVPKDRPAYGPEWHFCSRILSVQNCTPLTSRADKPVKNDAWVVNGDAHLVRADDQWIDAWGEDAAAKKWLRRSHLGSTHNTRGRPSVYKEVMKDTSHVIIERIEFEMPWQWPPKSVQPFLKEGKLTAESISAGVRWFAPRAWRRPLTADEAVRLDEAIARRLAATPSRTAALRDLLVMVLSDARFLFYSDAETLTGLRNHELVARLASFLWRTVPDDALGRLAAKDTPVTDAELAQQVERMVADARSERFVADFAAGWLAFDKFDQIAVDPNYYGWWEPEFKPYMKKEAIAFLSTLLRENLSCLNLLSSDFVVVNDVMAKFYGMAPPASGHRYSKVPAPPHRGGVLTLPAFLLAHSTGADSHVVQRGVWLRGRLLGDPPRDPPPGVPALADLQVGDADRLSVKDRLAAHGQGTCYDCHKDIDPWGIALEEFDATGKFRSRILRIAEGKHRLQLPVVATTEIRQFPVSGGDALRRYLLASRRDDFARGFSACILSFALGRPLNYQDDDMVTQVAAQFKAGDYRLEALLKAIVTHPGFRHPSRKK